MGAALRVIGALLRREWVLGAILGGILGMAATVLGFSLAVWWDLYKTERETEQRHQGYVAAIIDELLANRGHAQHNASDLATDVCALELGVTLARPIASYRTGAWDIVRLDPPGELVQHGRLAKLRDIYHHAYYLNDGIRSRELYRIVQLGFDPTFRHRLAEHDQELRRASLDLERQIWEFGRGWPGFERAAKEEGFHDQPKSAQEGRTVKCVPASPAPPQPHK